MSGERSADTVWRSTDATESDASGADESACAGGVTGVTNDTVISTAQAPATTAEIRRFDIPCPIPTNLGTVVSTDNPRNPDQ